MGHMLHARARTTPEVHVERYKIVKMLPMTLAQRYADKHQTIAK